jgi:Tol biopolymer transport system component
MRTTTFLLALLLVAFAACAPRGGATSDPIATDARDAAELLGAGTLSTDANEYNPSLAPDGHTLVFARSAPDFRQARIMVSRLRDGRWSAPEPVPFADARWDDSDPTFAPDGRTLYFVSNRPAAGRDSARRDLDLWRVRRDGDAWGTPEHLGDAVNSRAQELGPTWHDGRLYFASSRGGRERMLDIFQARDTAGRFATAVAVTEWNTPASESDVELSADGRTVLFWSDRPGGQGSADVWASRRDGDRWSEARPLASAINSPAFDFTPSFSRDGRWLYFASTRAPAPGAPTPVGQSNLYRMRTRAVLP